jgi:peptidoglycan/xylan/chitin deacetylase (PgdA/CDA1 family)
MILMDVRRLVQWLWAVLLASTGCLWWAKRQLLREGAVVALMFHRVLGEVDYHRTHSLPGIVVREHTFRELLEHIARRCELVDLRAANPGKPSRRLKVAVTFDDGWSDNYTVAFPIVRSLQIPITVFVCPGLVGKNSPFWPEQVIALLKAVKPRTGSREVTELVENLKHASSELRERYLMELTEQARQQGKCVKAETTDGLLSWPQIKEMAQAGIRFGSHTQTHQILTTVEGDKAHEEVLGSKAAIESMLGKPCAVFAYPNGNRSAETRRILAGAGFELAVTTERSAWTASCDPLEIPRANVYEGNLVGPTNQFSPAMFEYTTFWKTWRATKVNKLQKIRAQQQPASAAV